MTGTMTKYYLLSFLSALVVGIGMLVVAPSAQAQQQPDPITVDKECTPNPVQIGGQLTCIIDVEPASPQTLIFVEVRDAFPAGIRPTVAKQEQFVGDVVVDTVACPVSRNNTVICPIGLVADESLDEGAIRVTIEAIAEHCGTFTNTAQALRFPTGAVVKTGTEEIIVEGCEVPPEPDQQQPNQQQGSPTPITQEGEQESDAGEIDQSFDIS